MIEILGLISALILFIFFTIKGVYICLSIIFSIFIVALTNNLSFFDCLSQNFSNGFSKFIGQWWLLFVLGAVYGEIIKKTNLAKYIANILLKSFKNRGVLVILIISAIMSYGGIGTFIIAFTIYPIAIEIFKQSKISINLLPAIMLFCPTTICMTMIPGTPSIQNIIPTKYLGTTIYAAPLLGIIASIICFFLGYLYFNFHIKQNNITEIKLQEKINKKDFLALIPCVILWCVSFLGINFKLKSSYIIEIAILSGIVSTLIISKAFYKNIETIKSIENGIKNGFQTIIITSCIMGYGSVISSTVGFEKVINYFLYFQNDNILPSILIINIIALITGSSVASLSLFFENFLFWVKDLTIPLEQLHRILVIASGGMDSMPYATGIIVANDLAKTDLRKTYIHIFITCAIIPLLTLGIVLLIIYLL